MRGLIKKESCCNRFFAVFCIAVIIFLTVAASLRFYTLIPGIPKVKTGRLDSGWFYEHEGNLHEIEQLPCSLDVSGNKLYIQHDLSGINQDKDDIFVFRTRYQSIRVWADDKVIYEAAQGKEHALSSMWHFVQLKSCEDASLLRVELIKYDQKANWVLPSVIMDHSDAILIQLLYDHAPAIVFWTLCMMFTLVLIFVSILMSMRKIKGISMILALAAFIFISAQWILLDSKVTTLLGGNYALTYFLSYCAFYLLPAPFALHIRLILDKENRYLRFLSCAVLLNAAICMGLHLFGLVSIRNTTFTVHILIIAITVVSVRTFICGVLKNEDKRLMCTFFGIFIICVSALISIILYRIEILPPTNNAVLYSWALLVMTVCMAADAVSYVEQMQKQNQYIEHYRQLAVQDSMTMLENRNAYEARIKDFALNHPDMLIFILFDIDDLKIINDTRGHHVGDQAIYIVSQCIREIFDSIGSCYRIGGDEFCVILTSECDVPRKLRKFDEMLKDQSSITIPITVSYGWAKSSFEDGRKVSAEDFEKLQKAADMNMYRDKKRRKEGTKKETISNEQDTE